MMADPLTASITGAAKDVMTVLFVIIGLLILIGIIKWIQALKGRGTEIRVYRAPE